MTAVKGATKLEKPVQSDPHPSQPSVWSYKPWWCQPWSILLTGISLTGGSWFFFKNWLLTLIIGTPLTAWMGFFLLVYPRWVMQNGLLETAEEPAKNGRSMEF